MKTIQLQKLASPFAYGGTDGEQMPSPRVIPETDLDRAVLNALIARTMDRLNDPKCAYMRALLPAENAAEWIVKNGAYHVEIPLPPRWSEDGTYVEAYVVFEEEEGEIFPPFESISCRLWVEQCHDGEILVGIEILGDDHFIGVRCTLFGWNHQYLNLQKKAVPKPD